MKMLKWSVRGAGWRQWLVANGSLFLSLDTTPTGAETLRGVLHAVTGSTAYDDRQ